MCCCWVYLICILYIIIPYLIKMAGLFTGGQSAAISSSYEYDYHAMNMIIALLVYHRGIYFDNTIFSRNPVERLMSKFSWSLNFAGYLTCMRK